MRLADELFHDEVGASVFERSEVVHLADVGVPDARRRLRLLVKTPHRVLLAELARVQDLDGALTTDADVHGLED